ncbi:MAG: FtsX-like permease family protein [Spirochaetales bacterium]|nr:FtsX-like permease family protein [Spirochaetales bacterium]
MPSTFYLALKNTRLNFRKRLPVGIFLVAAMALLFIGNALFTNTQDGLKNTYVRSLTGDLSVSATSSDGFTLFGSELPLIGEFFKIPLLPRYQELSSLLSKSDPRASVPVIIGGAQVTDGRFKGLSPFFAVNLVDYFHFFPDLKILQGTPPPPGTPALFLNAQLYHEVSVSLGHAPALGEKFMLATAQENSFTLREVPLAGVFAYPVTDKLFDSVILIDADTGRQLNGYYVSDTYKAPKAQSDLLTDNLNDLFSSSSDVVSTKGSGLTIQDVTKDIQSDTHAPKADPGTWNFVLLKIKKGTKTSAAEQALRASLAAQKLGVQVRDWRDTAGGNAKVVWFLQLLFNIGLVFISLVACLIVMNSLALSVAERTREIGTLRALGAQKSKVASLIGYETLILVTGAGILGVLLGAFALEVVAHTGGVRLTNPLIASLFGADRYIPHVAPLLMLEHFGVSLVLGLLSMLLPIRKALLIVPIQAMARE